MRAAALKRDKHAVIGRPGGGRGAAPARAAPAPARRGGVGGGGGGEGVPAVVGAAIGERAGEGVIERAPENGERGAVVLRSGIEILPEDDWGRARLNASEKV